MNTVFGNLPFYDSVDKQDVNRTKAIIPVLSPRTQLPPFQIDLGTDTIATVDKITLVRKYPNISSIIASWTGSTFDTFTSSGTNITSVISAGGTKRCFSKYPLTKGSVYFPADLGEEITIVCNLTLNSGAAPTIKVVDAGAVSTISNTETLSAGANTVSLILTAATDWGVIWIETTGASNFSLTVSSSVFDGEINLIDYFPTFPQPYSPTDTSLNDYIKYKGDTLDNVLPKGVYYIKITGDGYTYYSDYIRVDTYSDVIKIAFSNSSNIGNILYEDSQVQTIWLDTTLNNPTHEIVNIGEEKDGTFIAEKIVTKLVYQIICYITRGQYNCLIRLPQHDTITITDEVGNIYSPEVGNVIVDPIEWVTYETGRLTIRFMIDDSNIKWTK